MIVRIESIRNSDSLLVISETDKYLGQLESIEHFTNCLEDREPFEEDEYIWHYIKNDCLCLEK